MLELVVYFILFFFASLMQQVFISIISGVGCGGEIFNYGGQLASPGYPNTNRNNTDCTWIINAPMNLVVALQFAGLF